MFFISKNKIMKNTILLFLMVFITNLTHAQWESFQNLDFSQKAIDSLTGKSHWQSKDFVKIEKNAKLKNCNDQSFVKISGPYSEQKPGYVFQQHPIGVNDFVKLRVSAKLKGEDIKDGKGQIYCYTKNGEQWLQYANLMEGAVEGTSDWKKVSVDIWVSPKAKTLRIGATLSGSGNLLIDDFKIEPVEIEECEMDPSYLAFMEECMDTIMTHSLYKDDIDRDQLMKHWKRLSSCAESIEKVQNEMGNILRLIDNHSFYMPLKKVEDWQSPTPSDKKSMTTFSKGHHIDENYAYIWMPFFSSGDNGAGVRFADQMQYLIDSLDNKNIKGWVLDLRDNQGGNCWPMLAGIGPILGEGTCGYFQYGNEFASWAYEKGASVSSGGRVTEITKEYIPFIKNPKVAVLTGPQTASSGEVVTGAFKNRPGARSFGQHTGGYSTGNQNFGLSDGSMIFLASSVYTDRDKNAYLHGIPPDVEIADDKETEKDETLEAAVKWLKSQEK